jgi:hypothetical protein
VWDAIPDEAKKNIKTPGQLVYMLGYDITSSAPQIKGNETLGETPVVNENLTEDKAKELGVTDIDLRNKFLNLSKIHHHLTQALYATYSN